MLREVILLKELDHPNIIRMHEVYEEKASFYLVTEICEGGELFDVITQLKNFNES